MKHLRHFAAILAAVAVVGMLAVVDAASAQGKGKGKGKGKQSHHNAMQLLGDKIKTNGHHKIDQKGEYETSVDVRNGKVAGLQVKHAQKGDIPVTKYKTNKRMALLIDDEQADGFRLASLTQEQYLGTVYIGYGYVDEYGNEDIYWFPYDMILDGDTGAIEYVPV